MMNLWHNWVFLALLSPLFYASINFFDKYLVSEKVKDGRGVVIYSSGVAAFFGTILWLIYGISTVAWQDAVLIMLTGTTIAYALVFYYDALVEAETSTVLLLAELTPVISLVLAFALLGERIDGAQSVGFLVILAASVFLAFSEEKKKETTNQRGTGFSQERENQEKNTVFLGLGRVFWLVIGVDILYACSNVLVKFVSENHSFTDILIFESFGMFFGGLSYYCFSSRARASFHGSVLTVGAAVLVLMTVSEVFLLSAKATAFRAISLGPVSLVGVVLNVQALYVVVLGFFLTLLAPRIFREDVSREGFLQKLALGGVMIFGIWLVGG
jgi:drug/metabolite transporter (DMT)-like permease